MRVCYPAAGVLAFLAALSSSAAEPCPKNCSTGKIPLGIAAPLTGGAASLGRSAGKASDLAIQEINSAGGLLGVPVEPVVADDRCDAGMAAAIVKKHVESQVVFVIGPTCPSVAKDAAPAYAKAGVIQFVPIITSIELTQNHPGTIFRMISNDEQEAKALAAYLASEHPNKRLLVVFGEFFYRRAIARMIDAALSPEQKKLTRLESLAAVTGAYDRLADRLQKNPPDVIYMSLDAEHAAEFVKALRERNIKSVLMGGQHFLSASFWQKYKTAAEGIHVIAPIASLDHTALRKAVGLLKQADLVPDIVALSHFAAVQTWGEAVRRAGSGEPKAVVGALRSGTFDTAIGPVAFDDKGDRRDIRYSILTWQNGSITQGLAWRP
jgi:branched-chain amino acid transport system substrate-binding protein